MFDQTPAALIRVALVEDDARFHDTFCTAVEQAGDMLLAGLATSRTEALQMLQQPSADVLVVDLGLPDGSGIDVIRAAQTRWPTCGVLVSSMFGDEAHVLRSIEAGACGYLLKDSSCLDIAREIRIVHAGGSPVSPTIARQVLRRLQAGNPGASPISTTHVEPLARALSPREQEVLQHVTKGFNYDEVAGLMGVSRHTVLTFVRRIYAKLEVHSCTEAIFEARQHGLLSD